MNQLNTTAQYLEWALTKDRSPAQYKELTDRLASNPKLLQSLHAAIGISGEAGELIDAVKKSAMYGKELDVTNIKEELGDICWYMALMLESIGSNFMEVMQMNHDKLEKRYPSGFSEKAAQVRADKVEYMNKTFPRGPKKKSVTVHLVGVTGQNLISVIKIIRNGSGLGLKESADIVRAGKGKIIRTSYAAGYKLADELYTIGCAVKVV